MVQYKVVLQAREQVNMKMATYAEAHELIM